MNLKSKEVNTVAGKGVQGTDKEGGQLGTEQPLASPWDVCLAHSSNSDDPDLLIIANAGTHQIWGLALRDLTWWKKMHLEAGRCLRLAGSGAEENRNNSYPAKAAFAQPSGISCGVLQSPSADYLLFVADSESSSIRQINLKDGSVKALVGGGKDPMVSNLAAAGKLSSLSIQLTTTKFLCRIYFVLEIKTITATPKVQFCFSILWVLLGVRLAKYST